jgi:hypothetical protein
MGDTGDLLEPMGASVRLVAYSRYAVPSRDLRLSRGTGIAQSVLRLATGWATEGSEFESP